MPVTIKQDKLTIELDASKLANAAAVVIATKHRERIKAGVKGDGSGPQKGPVPGDKNGIRGYDTGAFADSIKPHKSSKAKKRAKVIIGPKGMDNARWKWLGREVNKRGVQYFYAGVDGTPLAEEVDRELQKHLDEMIK